MYSPGMQVMVAGSDGIPTQAAQIVRPVLQGRKRGYEVRYPNGVHDLVHESIVIPPPPPVLPYRPSKQRTLNRGAIPGMQKKIEAALRKWRLDDKYYELIEGLAENLLKEGYSLDDAVDGGARTTLHLKTSHRVINDDAEDRQLNPYGHLLHAPKNPEHTGLSVYYQLRKPPNGRLLSMAAGRNIEWDRSKRAYVYADTRAYVGGSKDGASNFNAVKATLGIDRATELRLKAAFGSEYQPMNDAMIEQFMAFRTSRPDVFAEVMESIAPMPAPKAPKAPKEKKAKAPKAKKATAAATTNAEAVVEAKAEVLEVVTEAIMANLSPVAIEAAIEVGNAVAEDKTIPPKQRAKAAEKAAVATAKQVEKAVEKEEAKAEATSTQSDAALMEALFGSFSKTVAGLGK